MLWGYAMLPSLPPIPSGGNITTVMSLNEEFATTWDGWEVEKTAVPLSCNR